jgi:hypothetical protein
MRAFSMPCDAFVAFLARRGAQALDFQRGCGLKVYQCISIGHGAKECAACRFDTIAGAFRIWAARRAHPLSFRPDASK